VTVLAVELLLVIFYLYRSLFCLSYVLIMNFWVVYRQIVRDANNWKFKKRRL